MRTLGRRVLAYCTAALPHPSPPGFRPLPESPMTLRRRPQRELHVRGSKSDFHSNRTRRLPPAHHGMKIWSIAVVDGTSSGSTPGWGQSATFLLGPWAVVVRASGWRRRPEPEFIPDRSPGHAFVPIADRRHTQGLKIGLRWLVEVSWVSLVPPLDSGFRRNDDWGPD